MPQDDPYAAMTKLVIAGMREGVRLLAAEVVKALPKPADPPVAAATTTAGPKPGVGHHARTQPIPLTVHVQRGQVMAVHFDDVPVPFTAYHERGGVFPPAPTGVGVISVMIQETGFR